VRGSVSPRWDGGAYGEIRAPSQHPITSPSLRDGPLPLPLGGEESSAAGYPRRPASRRLVVLDIGEKR